MIMLYLKLCYSEMCFKGTALYSEENRMLNIYVIMIRAQNEMSNNLTCANSKGSDQPAHARSLIRAIASRLNIL